MKTFHIGDGQKTIDCGEDFECDGADGDTQTLTKAGCPNGFIRITVISIDFKPGTPSGKLRIDVREKAKKAGCKTAEIKDVTYFIGNSAPTQDGCAIQIGYAAIENHEAIFSLTTPGDSSLVEAFLTDMRSMIESLRVRKQGDLSYADLTAAHKNGIANALRWLEESENSTSGSFDLCEAIQRSVHAVVDNRTDRSHRGSIGLGFGELLRRKIPGLDWKILVDDEGTIHCLQYLQSSVTIFATAMVWKRIERNEAFDVAGLVAGTVKTIHDMIQKVR